MLRLKKCILSSNDLKTIWIESGNVMNEGRFLRVINIVPIVMTWLMFIGILIFIILNAGDLQELNMLTIWVIGLIGVFIVALFGTYKIWQWIREGKL
ncbi:MAG: hypothetical protein LPK26_14860 [Bacillaceae bacterium]|nr:hypothetical protein [Bacillaceae bacterium]